MYFWLDGWITWQRIRPMMGILAGFTNSKQVSVVAWRLRSVSFAGGFLGNAVNFVAVGKLRVYRVNHVDGALFNGTYVDTNWLWCSSQSSLPRYPHFLGVRGRMRWKHQEEIQQNCLNCNIGTKPKNNEGFHHVQHFCRSSLIFFLMTSGPLPSVFAWLSGPFLLSLETKKQIKSGIISHTELQYWV